MSDVNFLTWNIKDHDIKDKKTTPDAREQLLNQRATLYTHLLAELNRRKTHILVLQECFREEGVQLLTGYKEVEGLVEGAKYGLRVLLRESAAFQISYVERFPKHRVLCMRLARNGEAAFNLIGVHLFSKAGPDAATQDDANYEFPALVKEYEEGDGRNKNSMVVGDLNYAPFDEFIIGPKRLNAIGDKDLIARLGTRQYQSRSWEFFYNPMWNLLGDVAAPTTGSAQARHGGSFFWEAKGATHHYWNLLDGVLLRPSLMHNLLPNSLQVLETINGQPLLKSHAKMGWVHTSHADHLPVAFTLTF
jgi:hypothetical protein